MAFDVTYSAGGKIDSISNLERIKLLELIDKIKSLDEVSTIKLLEEINLINQVDNVSTVEQINKINGFATKTQPYNTMKMFDIPAIKDRYEFEMTLPNVPIEVLALSVTCSGYGEEDSYDLYFNEKLWFDNWYCSEVKEGLFLGSSTYVYSAQESSKIRLVFRNTSGTSKKVWLGVRTLID